MNDKPLSGSEADSKTVSPNPTPEGESLPTQPNEIAEKAALKLGIELGYKPNSDNAALFDLLSQHFAHAIQEATKRHNKCLSTAAHAVMEAQQLIEQKDSEIARLRQQLEHYKELNANLAQEVQQAEADRDRLIDVLKSIRDEAVALVDAEKFQNSVLHVEAPRRIRNKANTALRA